MVGTQQQHITILLIEDEALIRMGTSAMLEDAGYQVLEAANAQEALGLLRDNPAICIAVTDVQMPGSVDGLALCKIIARDFPRVRTLVTSGRSSPQDACACGAKKFLSKPYTATVMQKTVEAMLA